MSNLLITWKKELRGIFRDKKYLSIIFLMPLIIPMFIILMGSFYDSMDSVSNNKIGLNYELSEVESEILKSVDKNIEVKTESEEELKQSFENGDINAYVIKNNDNYYLYIDTSSSDGMNLSAILNTYFEQYNNYLAKNYLIENHIDPDNVFNIVKVDLKEQAKEGTNFFTNFLISFALIYLVMIITVTAMNTSTDIIAGEKERGTFETLLTFPLTSNEIIGGKLLSIITSCVISSLIGVGTSIPAFMYVKNNTQTFNELSLDFSAQTIILAIVALIAISALVSVICIFLVGKSKTFKEAQSKASFLSFVAIIPMFTNMMNVSNEVLYLIPVANGGQILNDLFLTGLNINNYLLFIGSSIVFTIIALLYVARQYKDESALF